MKNIKICECGKLMNYNSHFGGYYCASCGKLEIKKAIKIFRVQGGSVSGMGTKRKTKVRG